MPKLGVNIDHVATLREARQGREPDPVPVALQAEIAGANGITLHLREDRRHIQDRDTVLLRKTLQTHMNLEMAPIQEMVQTAINLEPDMVTLVPENRKEVTTEGGLNIVDKIDEINKIVNTLKTHNILVSLFIEPKLEQIKAARRTGAYAVEWHTGTYAQAYDYQYYNDHWQLHLDDLQKMTAIAKNYNLVVNAGHGLNYQNVTKIANIEGIEELNIGHSIISRSLHVGIQQAVKEMLILMNGK